MRKDKIKVPLVRRVLLTRPQAKNDSLALLLAQHNMASYNHPLLITKDYPAIVPSNFSQADIVIAISENAVKFSNKIVKNWPKESTYVAIGKGTQDCFKAIDIETEIPDIATTEGLLELACLRDVHHRNIIIIRGVGGRETLAETLIERGANVDYFEVYSRQLIEIKENVCVKQWQQHLINTIVVTSGEILEHIYANVGEEYLTWLQNLSLIVPSDRIAMLAKKLGARYIDVSDGADNQSILKTLLN